MALLLIVCLLVAQSFDVVGSTAGQLKRSASEKDKVIYFKAFLARDTLYGVGSTIAYSDVQHNIGGAYNPASGVFTAPVTGLYEFKYHVHRKAGQKAEFSLFNQQKQRASAISLHDYASSGVSTIMKVERGDHVFVKITWIDNNDHITLRSGFYNQFTGYLIRQL